MIEGTGNQFKSFALKFSLCGAVLVAVAAAYFYGTPKQYEASAKVRVWKSGNLHTNESAGAFGPEMLASECRVVVSADVLDKAAGALALQSNWVARFGQGKPPNPEQVRNRLRLISRVQPLGKSSVIDIRVSGIEPVEPAGIANAIARAYCELRQQRRSQAAEDRGRTLREQWSALTAKIQAAQEKLDRLCLEINASRATNSTRVFSADGYAKLQSKRIDLESQYVEDSKRLEEFKALDRDRLREVLSSQDSDPNSLLNGTILQLLKARRESAAAITDHGSDSQEARHAAIAVQELDKQVNRQVDAIMAGKEEDLLALKVSLDNLNRLSRQAGTNLDNATTKRMSEQDAAYAQARKELAAIEAEQDRLQQQMNATIADDVVPVTVTAEILDLAEPPVKPSVPDPKIAYGAAGAGVLGIFMGLVMLLVGLRVRKTSATLAR